MSAAVKRKVSRGEQTEYLATQLPSRLALLTRLLAREALHGELTQTEVGLLRTLEGGQRRISELAELEGLAQPTTTLLVKRLEESGLVSRHALLVTRHASEP